jgi:tetrahydromethanopterin S-methyltransferase subunit G
MTTTDSLRKLLQDMVLPELSQIRVEQAAQKNTLGLLQARVDEMSKRLDQVDAHLIDQSRRIDATNARIDQVRSELTEHIENVRSELTERIEKIHSDMILRNDETNRSIARLYEVIVRRDEHAELAARLSRLEHQVAELGKKLAA